MKLFRKTVHYLSVIAIIALAACGPAAVPDPNAAKPSRAGGIGQAVSLKGDIARGKDLFQNKCSECHGDEGKGGIVNGGSEDGSIPALNPIDPTLTNADPKVFAANLDLFIEHGSTPKGEPSRVMLGYGDLKILQPQQIADVIAYIIFLNTK